MLSAVNPVNQEFKRKAQQHLACSNYPALIDLLCASKAITKELLLEPIKKMLAHYEENDVLNAEAVTKLNTLFTDLLTELGAALTSMSVSTRKNESLLFKCSVLILRAQLQHYQTNYQIKDEDRATNNLMAIADLETALANLQELQVIHQAPLAFARAHGRLNQPNVEESNKQQQSRKQELKRTILNLQSDIYIMSGNDAQCLRCIEEYLANFAENDATTTKRLMIRKAYLLGEPVVEPEALSPVPTSASSSAADSTHLFGSPTAAAGHGGIAAPRVPTPPAPIISTPAPMQRQEQLLLSPHAAPSTAP